MHDRAQCAAGLLVLILASGPVGAQHPTTIEAGISTVRFPDDDSWVVGPSVRLRLSGSHGRFFGAADGGTVVAAGAASGFATLLGAARTSSLERWSAELGGELTSVAGTNSSGGAGMGLLSGRGIWSATDAGAWIRASGHLAARASGVLTGRGVELGAWRTWPRARLNGAVMQEWTTAELFTGRFRTGYAGTAPVRYLDGTMSLHLEDERRTLDLSVGARRDADAANLFEPALSATAAIWQRDTRALVVSVARVLPDWIRGADAIDAVSVGMRFRQATPAAERLETLIVVAQVVEQPAGRVLLVHAAGARQVEVMGDFTEWEVVRLAPRESVFARSIVAAAGSHRMLVRIDGGAWRVATNTPAVDDDLGGRAGILVVP